MRKDGLERTSFIAVFLSLVLILLYLAVALESARDGDIFWEHSHRAVTLVAEHAMKALLLTLLMGFGFDLYTKN